MECPICYELLKNKYVKLNCGHKFHHKCLELWSNVNKICPYCRCDIDYTLKRYKTRSYYKLNRDDLVERIKNLLNEIEKAPILKELAAVEVFITLNVNSDELILLGKKFNLVCLAKIKELNNTLKNKIEKKSIPIILAELLKYEMNITKKKIESSNLLHST